MHQVRETNTKTGESRILPMTFATRAKALAATVRFTFSGPAHLTYDLV